MGSILNAKVGFVADRSLKTLIQLSLIVVKGDIGVVFDDDDDDDVDAMANPVVGVVVVVVDDDDIDEFVVTDGFKSNIALSRKRVRAFDDDNRKAISNFVAKIIVRG